MNNRLTILEFKRINRTGHTCVARNENLATTKFNVRSFCTPSPHLTQWLACLRSLKGGC